MPLAQTADKLFAGIAGLAWSAEPASAVPADPGGSLSYRGLCGTLWRVEIDTLSTD